MSWPTFKTSAQPCPQCGYLLEMATAVQHDSSPDEGSLSVCLACGAFLAFGAKLELKLLGDAEFGDLPPHIKVQLRGMRTLVRELKGSARMIDPSLDHDEKTEPGGYVTCAQRGCTHLATHRFTWPGQDESKVCEPCSRRAAGVAAAMGVHLQVLTLEGA